MRRTEKRITKPSRWYYVLAALVFVLGAAGGIAYAGASLRVGANPRVVVPGTHEIQLDDSGKYTIFYEYRSLVDGRLYSTNESIPAIHVSLTAEDTLLPIEVSKPSVTSSYGTNHYSGKSLLEFNIDERGEYILTAEYEEGKTGPDVVLAIGQTNVAKMVIGLFAIVAVSLVLGSLIIVLTFVRRHIANTRMKAVSTSDTTGA